MTPLELSILIHYMGHADDFRGGDLSAPAVREAMSAFVDDELLELNHEAMPGDGRAAYRLTSRGVFFVEALCAMPLPVQKWVMP